MSRGYFIWYLQRLREFSKITIEILYQFNKREKWILLLNLLAEAWRDTIPLPAQTVITEIPVLSSSGQFMAGS